MKQNTKTTSLKAVAISENGFINFIESKEHQIHFPAAVQNPLCLIPHTSLVEWGE
jgi:hypothetical protein